MKKMAYCTVVLLLLVCVSIVAAQPVMCPVNCVCLVPVLTSCNNPVQRLGGLGASLPEIVPGSFSQASFVTDLMLDNNAPLLLHSGSFSGLTNITTLDLSDNAISSLPDGVFSTMPTLVSLDLSNNQLTSLNPGAFTGLVQLTTLILSRNQLTNVPVGELIAALPQLTSISLDANPIDCNTQDIDSLVRVVRSGLVANGDQLECSNGTTVISLNVTIHVILTTTVSIATTSMTITSISMTTNPISSTIATIRPTQVLQTTITSAVALATPTTVLPTSSERFSIIKATPIVTPTPSVPLSCTGEMTLLSSGYYDWSDTLISKEATLLCPHGPVEGVARRNCVASDQWGEVDDSECNDGSEATQLLAAISEVSVTAESSEFLSNQLAALPSTLLSVQELNTVLELAGELLNISGTNTQVLYNTLETFNTVFTSSSDTLGELSSHATNNIRQLIDSALLGALSADNPELAISFSHLAVGGAYLPATNHTLLLAVVKVSNDSVGLEVRSGARQDESGSDVTVEVDGPIRVQVTVYNQDDIFDQSNCSNTSDVMVVAPIISVVSEGGNTDNETVILSYRRVTSFTGVTYVCARWSSSEDCSGSTGRWNTVGCMLAMTNNGVLQCQCLHQGTFTLLTIPSEPFTETPPPSPDNLSLSAKVVFNSLCSFAVILFLAVVITVLAHSTLRSLPMLQLLVNLALSQSLTSLLMMVSFELTASRWVCYGLGVAVQYIVLVSLSWMGCLPLLVCIQVFKRLWYEKVWLIIPFLLLCWVWPVIPVVVYNGLRYSSFPEQPTICWLESVVFPNTITYVWVFVCIVVIATILISLLLLLCSNYILEASTYYQPLGLLVNFVLYVAMVISQFFTAAAAQFNINPFYLLLVTGGLMIICASYFFAIYGIVQSKVRHALLCSHCDQTKRPPSDQAHSSGRTSQSSYRMKSRRAPTRITDEMNINYVDDYLGFPHRVPVPMAMLNQVQHGRVIRRTNDPINGVFVQNPMYRISLTSDP